jgi:hypothetical protein
VGLYTSDPRIPIQDYTTMNDEQPRYYLHAARKLNLDKINIGIGDHLCWYKPPTSKPTKIRQSMYLIIQKEDNILIKHRSANGILRTISTINSFKFGLLKRRLKKLQKENDETR